MPGYSGILAGGTRAPIRGELTLGRAAGDQLRLAGAAVLRPLAPLIATARGFEVHDLGSSSGTYLNGHRIASCAVAGDGHGLRVGDTRLRVERDREGHEGWPTHIVPTGA